MTSSHAYGPRRSRPRAAERPARSAFPADGRVSGWVKVTCPSCGLVRVRSDRVVVRYCIDDRSWSYRARCSSCDVTFVGATPAELALPAVAAGLAVERWSLPQPSARRAGLALHAVDALELHLALLEPDWFEQLERVEPLDER